MYQTSFEDDCVKMSVINAVRIIRGSNSVVHVFKVLRKDSTVFHNFKPFGFLFHKLGQGLEVWRLCKEGNRALYSKNRCDRVKWLCSQRREVWLVRLLQNGHVDHCVYVDEERALI